ncbi:MAG: hypothetical protein ACI9OH_000749 [Oleispira sp.]|jgi:hypothetical protein
MKNILSLFLPLMLLAGCTHSIHMVHTDGFDLGMPADGKAHYVEAVATQNVIFFFAFDTDYVDEAKAALEQQCSGKLSAVSTQYSTSHGFFHWTNKILMKGLCG